jgi:hypothetical protein
MNLKFFACNEYLETIRPVLKSPLNLSAMIVASLVVTVNCAEARHYRHVAVSSDYVLSAASCVPPPPPPSYIFPASNWEPFFRRHFYRYGPIVVCDPSAVTTNLISARY